MMVVQHQPTLATRSRTQSGFSGKPMQCPPLPVSLSVQTVPSSKCVLSPLRWPNWPMPSASRSVEPLVAKSDLAFPCRSSDREQITDDFEYWRVLTEDSFIFWWGWDLADGVLTFQLKPPSILLDTVLDCLFGTPLQLWRIAKRSSMLRHITAHCPEISPWLKY